MAEASLVKAEDIEVLARKSLVADSARLKVAISRRVREIVARLEDPSVPVRSAAQALGSLAPIFRLIDGWSQQPDSQRMKLARAGDDEVRVKSLYQHWLEGTEPPECTGAVNLALIETTPEQLAEMAEAEENRDRQRGPCLTECNGLSIGPSAVAPEQSPAATHGCPIPKKEAPPLPVNQPVQPCWETTVVPPPPLSPQERRRRELERTGSSPGGMARTAVTTRWEEAVEFVRPRRGCGQLGWAGP